MVDDDEAGAKLRPVFKGGSDLGTELHHLSGLSHSEETDVAAANFSEGHYLQVEVAARTAASKQPAAGEISVYGFSGFSECDPNR